MSKPTDWKLRLDSILHDARAEAAGRQPAGKTASAPAQAAPATLVKQAEDVVAAIKLVTGQTSQATLAEILRKEGEAGKSPGVTSTTTGGTQAEPPRSGSASVTQSPGPKAARPTESAAGTKGASLHDIITRGREAAEKSAGKGGPAELEAGDPSGKTPAGLTRLVGTSEAVVDMTKRDALAQTRPSLQSLLKNVNDSANEAAARAAFPAAVAKGGLKIASDLELARSLQKEALSREEFNALTQEPQSLPGRVFHRLGVGFNTPEHRRELEDTGEFGSQGVLRHLARAGKGALGGGVLGAAVGAGAGHLSGHGAMDGAAVGAPLGASLGLIGGNVASDVAMARAQRAAEDKSLTDKGFQIAYEDRAHPLLTRVLGQRRTSTPPPTDERTASATPHQIAIAMQRQQSAAAV